MNSDDDTIPIIESISKLAPAYEAWLCDIWGVVHNGVRPFPKASAALETFRQHGGVVVLLTNSPRRSVDVRTQLNEIGVSNEAYDGVVSSGDVAQAILARRQGRPVFHLGPERDRVVFDGLNIELSAPDKAEIVLCSGLFDDETETADDYHQLLNDLIDRQLPLICSNPDIQVERGDKLIYCAGALAELYKSKGGEVIYTGKPAMPIYELALNSLETLCGRTVPHEKILAIGDGLKTDMPGAAAARLDALFVASALHVDGHHADAKLNGKKVAQLFQGMQQMPIAAMPRLAW